MSHHNHHHHRRRRPRIHLRGEPGAKPGTIKADRTAPPPKIHVKAFGPDKIVERDVETPAGVAEFVGHWPVTWIDVTGLGDAATIRKLGEMFNIHSLALEDVVNVSQRPKVEEYDDLVYIVARMIHDGEDLTTEQVSIFLGKNFVLTFQEREGDSFEQVRERLRLSKSKMRNSKADYLAYRLLDAILDAYFPVLEEYGDRLELLDDEISTHPSPVTFHQIHDVKSDLILIRRAIWPHRDALIELMREGDALVTDETRVFLRDCYDHTVQLIDLVETYREICGDLRDFYLSTISNKMNEIMKVLTIIATIFIPLGFIAGVYGMNFDYSVSHWNMPETHWVFGYPFAISLMLIVAIGMLIFFRRRGWLGGESSGTPPSTRDNSP